MDSTRVRSALFYFGCVVILVVLMTKSLTHILPGELAHEINDESEAFPIAILFCGYVQYVRTTTKDSSRSRWSVAVVSAALSLVIAWLLLTLSLPSSVVTLNESFVAVGVMIVCATFRRPIPWAPALTVALLIAIAILQSNPFVTAQAEGLVPIALMPAAFLWADRRILNREATDRPLRRAIWCVLLVLVPVVARWHLDIGSHEDVLLYIRRATEGFLGLLLIHLFFSYWLAPWRRSGDAVVTGVTTPVTSGPRATSAK